MVAGGQQIGQLIRQLRRQQGMTGAELGRKAGLSQSKISKIETGSYAVLRPVEVEKILNILNASKTIRQQFAVALGDMRARNTWVKVYNVHLGIKPPEYRQHIKKYRVFGINIIPALLQIPPYRYAVLQSYGIEQDAIREWMKEMVKRQDFLWQKGLSFHFIMSEAALYTLPANIEAQVEQLDRVERMIGMPNITIGIVPLQAGLTVTENASFVLHDDKRLVKTIGNGEIESTNEEDLILHARIFKELERSSVVESEAKELIGKARKYFFAS